MLTYSAEKARKFVYVLLFLLLLLALSTSMFYILNLRVAHEIFSLTKQKQLNYL